MTDVLLALLVIATALFALSAGVTAALFWWLQRRNRVHPKSKVRPPLRWLAAPGSAARLHRELRSAARLVTASDTSSEPLSALATDLVTQAIALDASLVATSRLPAAARRPRIRELTVSIRSVTDAAGRIQRLSERYAGPDHEGTRTDSLVELAERLHHLEAAHLELQRLTSAPAGRIPLGAVNRRSIP